MARRVGIWVWCALALVLGQRPAHADDDAAKRPAAPAVTALLRALEADDLVAVDRWANPASAIDAFEADPWVLVEELLLAGRAEQARAFASRVKTEDGGALRRYVDGAAGLALDLPARRMYVDVAAGRKGRDEASRGEVLTAPWSDPVAWGRTVSGLLTMSVVVSVIRDEHATAVLTAQATAEAAQRLGWTAFEMIYASEVADLRQDLARKTRASDAIQAAHEAVLRAAELVGKVPLRSVPRGLVIARRNAALALLNRLVTGQPDLEDPSLFPRAVEFARTAVASITPEVPVSDRYLARLTLVDALIAVAAYGEAEEALRELEAPELSKGGGDDAKFEVLSRRMEVRDGMGDLPGALAASERYVTAAAGQPPSWNLAIRIREHAWLLHRMGRSDEAWAAFARAASVARPVGHLLEEDVLMKEGIARFQRQEWAEGTRCMDKCIPAFRRAGQKKLLAQSLRYRAGASERMGRYGEASRDAKEAWELASAMESAPELAATRLVLAKVLASQEQGRAGTDESIKAHLVAILALTLDKTDPSSLDSRAAALDELASLEDRFGMDVDAKTHREEATRIRAGLSKRRGFTPDPFGSQPAGPSRGLPAPTAPASPKSPAAPVPASTPWPPELPEQEAVRLIRIFYDTIGEFAGQYRLGRVERVRLDASDGRVVVLHVAYTYVPVARGSRGSDARVFRLERRGDAWVVERMGPAQSARFPGG